MGKNNTNKLKAAMDLIPLKLRYIHFTTIIKGILPNLRKNIDTEKERQA